MENNFDPKRIAKNSMYLAFRMLFTMGLSLYTTRLVLKNLGVEDYGVYSVVGGIVWLFAVSSNALTSTIDRFLSYELGNNKGNMNRIFCTSMNLVLFFALLTLIILEFAGVWLLNNKLNIPPESMHAARWVFQFSVLTAMITMISIPYNSLIIAHEKMNVFAFISIFQVVLRCASAYLISFFEFNRLIWYALFMFITVLLFRLLYQVYCRIKMPESKYHFLFDKSLLKEIGKFSGITLVDSMAVVLFTQGFNILLNIYFGVSINGVYSIASQVKNSILSFAQNLQKSIEPPIYKTYAANEMNKFTQLIYTGSKMQLFLIILAIVPLSIRINQILALWLENVPTFTDKFVVLFVIISALYACTGPVISGAFATGKIKRFLLITDGFYLVSLGLLYLLGKVFESPIIFIYALVIIEIIVAAIRVVIFSMISKFQLIEFTKQTLGPSILILAISYPIIKFINNYLSQDITGLFLLLIISSIIILVLVYIIGTNKKEKAMINSKLKLPFKK